MPLKRPKRPPRLPAVGVGVGVGTGAGPPLPPCPPLPPSSPASSAPSAPLPPSRAARAALRLSLVLPAARPWPTSTAAASSSLSPASVLSGVREKRFLTAAPRERGDGDL